MLHLRLRNSLLSLSYVYNLRARSCSEFETTKSTLYAQTIIASLEGEIKGGG